MERTITVTEMKKELRICKKTAYKLANSIEFYPAFRIGKKILIDREKLEQWITENSTQKGARQNATCNNG